MDGPAVPLLQTKLRAPAARRALVPRPRLAALLAGPGSASLTLVSAAAGFGKTTLVAECLAGTPGTAWLSLDPRDDDPQTFWTYVVAALETVRPGVGARAQSLLQAPLPSADAVVATLLNDLDADRGPRAGARRLPRGRGAGVHEAVAFLLEHLPAACAPRARDPRRPAAAAGRACAPAATWSRSALPTCASPPTRPRRT